jgi:uncharacterized protein YutE (UPF0331/DUF86 family)
VVDEVRLARLLRSVSDDLAVLRGEAAADVARRADPMWLRGVKYTFVTAIEACVDAAQHVCSSQGWGPPADNVDAMRVLGRHGVLDPELAERLRRAVGFRNLLVHEYVEVDDDIVLSRLADHADLAAFVAALTRMIVR